MEMQHASVTSKEYLLGLLSQAIEHRAAGRELHEKIREAIEANKEPEPREVVRCQICGWTGKDPAGEEGEYYCPECGNSEDTLEIVWIIPGEEDSDDHQSTRVLSR